MSADRRRRPAPLSRPGLRLRPVALAATVAGAALAGCRPEPAESRRIVAGEGAGALTRSSGESELRREYGDASVRRMRLQLGEGETAPGTVLFPDDSLARLDVLWRDTLARRGPARLILRGARSRWSVGPGVTLGTTLRELERRNGRPFTLAGFGWDYGGVVTDWRGGALEEPLRGVTLYLDPGPEQYRTALYGRVLGDRDFASGDSTMQVLNPRVYQIFVDFE